MAPLYLRRLYSSRPDAVLLIWQHRPAKRGPFLCLEKPQMPITEQQLLQILPKARTVAGIFLPGENQCVHRNAA